MNKEKEELHKLIDALPDHHMIVAKGFLEYLLDAEKRLENIELEKEFGYRAILKDLSSSNFQDVEQLQIL